MVAIATFLVLVLLSLVVERVAMVGLMQTGMSKEASRFQVRSAWTGTGFTTAETEQITGHPARRHIIQLLMIVRGGGFLTAIATLITGLKDTEELPAEWRIVILVGGMGVVFGLLYTPPVVWAIEAVSRQGLKRFAGLDVADYNAILNLSGGYSVSEVVIDAGDWVEGRSLIELDLQHEGVLVLSVRTAEGAFLGAPRGSYVIRAGDVVTLYGLEERLIDIECRRRGADGEARRARQVAAYEREKAGDGESAETAALNSAS